jgi:uncharacterized membrane protein
MNAPRSIDQYLSQLRRALAGEDAALIQDALYDAEEYLRAEVAAHPDKSEADVLELIASTYGDPEEVAAAYRDTEVKVKAALKTPVRPSAVSDNPLRRFFGVFTDARAYTSLFFMLLSLATGIIYFTVAVAGLSMSFGFAILIIGIPFFLLFIGLTRVMSLAEGRLIEAMTGERMPRRPVHPGPPLGFWARIGQMLKDVKTWSTLVYFILMLPLGVVYFAIAVTGLSVSLSCIFAPLAEFARRFGWLSANLWGGGDFYVDSHQIAAPWLESPLHMVLLMMLGILLLTVLMHAARGIGRLHAMFAKALLVAG